MINLHQTTNKHQSLSLRYDSIWADCLTSHQIDSATHHVIHICYDMAVVLYHDYVFDIM